MAAEEEGDRVGWRIVQQVEDMKRVVDPVERAL